MPFEPSAKVQDLQRRLYAFMDEHIYPNEQRHVEEAETLGPWKVLPLMEELKPKARAVGLWNLFLPHADSTNLEYGTGLTNLEYAPLCEIMGRSLLAPEVFNCSAPDTGNMEVLARYGTPEHKKRWLEPLLAGEIRSCFAMTEPGVAASDATNISASIVREGDQYVINGHKWCACLRRTCCWVKAAGSRSRRAGWAPGASTTACARSAWPSARSSACAGARSRAWRSASRWRSRA